MCGLFGFFFPVFIAAASTDMNSSRFGIGDCCLQLFVVITGILKRDVCLILQSKSGANGMTQQTTEFSEFIALPAFLRHPPELLSMALDYAQAQCTAAHAFDGKSHDGPLTCHSNICRVHRWCSGDCVPGGSFASCCVCGNLICPACPRLSSLCTICFARLWPTSFRRICHRKLRRELTKNVSGFG